jgi:serine/alanine adding enzyme
MNYRFAADISPKDYMAWLTTQPNYNITQTPMWAKIKIDWKSTLCLLYADEKPIAGALLLIRRFAPGLKIIYSPRGFIIDYSDKEAVSAFTNGVITYAKKIGACMIRIDPEIVLSTYHDHTVIIDQLGKQKMDILNNIGFKHKGFDKDFHTYTQPRYNAEISLTDSEGCMLSDEFLAKSFDKKIRKFIGRYTANRGIFFEYDIGENAVRHFCEISRHTEERQHIVLRDEAYFKRICDSFGEDNVFFFAKINLEKLIAFLKEQIITGDSDSVALAEKDLEEAEILKKERGNIIPVSALLTVKSNFTAYLLYSGFDDSVFPRFRTTNQLRFEAMRFFRNKGCKTFSLLGIHGDLNDSLSDFKMKFNPTVVEYAGEFELPIKKFRYWLLSKAMPIAKRIYFKIKLKNK